ncbi:hypothetical protein [Falsibacillus pallidus]|uniref:Uncharacterized protein n=1 Tax=Falsibacillus pallidus TaxID=493781 RepID=A0A370G5I0_9BACI|nr:hypothetical protein [Falsibacillus pallidus]RDI38470.1 hypothetical protein DFR59_11711 [Falsibacillus pallidus]
MAMSKEEKVKIKLTPDKKKEAEDLVQKLKEADNLPEVRYYFRKVKKIIEEQE